MPLFHVQHDDRPMFVFAQNWGHAIKIWRDVLARENPGDDCSEEQPDGIARLAEDNDVAFAVPQPQCMEARNGERS